MKKIHENMHVLCFHEHKTSMFSKSYFPFSAYFYPPLHHNGKGSIKIVISIVPTEFV